jgi:adenine deaminase
VREAIKHGTPVMTALQMVTINPAEHFGVARDVGMIAPGRYGDVLIVNELESLTVEKVIANGKVIADHGKLCIDLPSYNYPDWVFNSIHLKRSLNETDFKLLAPRDGNYNAHVIGVIENQAPTKHLQMPVNANEGEVSADIGRDLAKIAVVERHKAGGAMQVGLVSGFGFNVACAIATTVAHDCHNLIVVGTSDTDMVMAANMLTSMGGGQIVVREGKVIGQVDLPIAGIISNECADIVAKKARTILDGFKACGCQLNNPNMQLSLLALVVIPELRISDLGLVDVNRFEFIQVLD